jgi:hypothetical protein
MTKEEKRKEIDKVENLQKGLIKELLIADKIEDIVSLVLRLRFLEVEKYTIAAIPFPKFQKGTPPLFSITETVTKEEIKP